MELKTVKTNRKTSGIKDSTRPVTKNIKSVISYTIKLNSSQGIVAFALFPIPCKAIICFH